LEVSGPALTNVYIVTKKRNIGAYVTIYIKILQKFGEKLQDCYIYQVKYYKID